MAPLEQSVSKGINLSKLFEMVHEASMVQNEEAADLASEIERQCTVGAWVKGKSCQI